jgi:HlyD family secretion protein
MSASESSPAASRRPATEPPGGPPGPDDFAPVPPWRRASVWIVLALVAVVAAGGYLWRSREQAAAAPSYVTETVARGNLNIKVTANGTLQPTQTVNIGSELSGTVTRVLVDVNDRVRKGQVLVELDTSKFADQVARSRAAVASATAKVAQAVATVKEAESNLARNREVARLSGGKVPSKSELDAAQAAFERAQADEAAARAAALSTDETNLSKASIRSPIDGVVLTRSVDPGNAVAASLQAVTLFTIAEDLTKMRLQVNVDEADVGMVEVGQSATFTVSAYPTRRYPAKVTRVAFGSTITDNVVTYITYLEVDNSDLSLRPGMTATATIKATERRDVLLVPNTALRYTPTATGAAAAKGGGFVSSLVPRRPPRAPKTATPAPGSAAARRVWVLRDGAPVAVAIKPGVSDGRMTEVVSGELQAGMQVIVDQRAAAES